MLFQWPESAMVHMPITKISLKQQPTISASESKLLEGPEIQKLTLEAIIKTSTANVDIYETQEFSFLEVYMVHVYLLPATYAKYYLPVARIVHKLVPHHCLVLTSDTTEQQNHLSLYTKKIHKTLPDQRVLAQEFVSPAFAKPLDADIAQAFLFANADKGHLQQLYQYYSTLVQNLQIAAETRKFTWRSGDALQLASEQLAELLAGQTQLYKLKQRLKKATQISDKVALTSQIHTLTTYLNTLQDLLK